MKEEKDNTMAEAFRQQQRALLGLGGPETMDAETLVNTPLAAIPFVVSELIPQGLHMIGGARVLLNAPVGLVPGTAYDRRGGQDRKVVVDAVAWPQDRQGRADLEL